MWLAGSAALTATGTSQIVFRGIAGDGIYSDIALDDISVSTDDCQSGNV